MCWLILSADDIQSPLGCSSHKLTFHRNIKDRTVPGIWASGPKLPSQSLPFLEVDDVSRVAFMLRRRTFVNIAHVVCGNCMGQCVSRHHHNLFYQWTLASCQVLCQALWFRRQNIQTILEFSFQPPGCGWLILCPLNCTIGVQVSGHLLILACLWGCLVIADCSRCEQPQHRELDSNGTKD